MNDVVLWLVLVLGRLKALLLPILWRCSGLKGVSEGVMDALPRDCLVSIDFDSADWAAVP